MYLHNTIHSFLSLHSIPLYVCFLHEDSYFFPVVFMSGVLDLDSEHPAGVTTGVGIKKDKNKYSCILSSFSFFFFFF